MTTIGETAAPSTNTIYYDALLSTTLMAYRKTLIDNIFKDSAFLAYIKLVGAIDKQNGGERISIPLMYGKNDTVKTHGGYSVIDTTPQDGLTTAFYPWAELAGSISISRKEERQNAGEGKLIDLLKSKIKQAEMSLREKVNSDLVVGTVNTATFVPDTAKDGSFGVLPLGYFFRKVPSTDPLVGGNVGNIAGASYSWWRHRCADFSSGSTPTGGDFGLAVTTYAGVEAALKRMYNFCARGSGGAPDLAVLDQVAMETYENSLATKVRYSNTKMADMGFDTIKLKGATCVWDEKVPDIYTGTAAIAKGTGFFLNTEFYRLVFDTESEFITTPFIEPENQTVKTAKVLAMMNATCSNLRKCGVAWGISQTIVA